MKRIVVLGAGYGGVLTAKKLAKKLRKQKDVHITLIDRNPYHTLLTELHEVAGNRTGEESIKINLHKIFGGFKNVTVVQDEITNVDFDAKQLTGDVEQYSYDYLVIGTGSKPTFFGTPGAEEFAFSLWSYEDAVELRLHVESMFRQAMKERDVEKRKRMLTFVVVGAGFTGVEMIGELAEFTQELCKTFNVDREEVNLHVVDMADRILPVLPDKLVKKAEKHLRKLNVNVITNKKITELTGDAVRLNGQTIASHTVIWTAGIEGSDIVASMDVKQEGRKRIVTNDKLQTPEHPEVYVVGDNIFFIPEGETQPVPQMVENAELAAPLIAHNIVADIRQKPKKAYKPTFHGMMVCIGSRYGVAYVGVPKMMIPLSGFMAMFVKHMINMLYQCQVSGFSQVYSYMKDEFFSVKNNRSFVGGHFAKRSPNFWLVPLRIMLGWMWMKQGWDKLLDIIDDPGRIFLIPAKALDGTAGASVADVTASATPYTQEALSALPVPGFLESMVNSSMDMMFYNAAGDFTAMAYVFQTSMVVGELLLGILLIVGLFTAPAAIITVLMGLMIWVSGTAPKEMLWYLAGGVAVIGGSGSTLGLDYYVLPKLKRAWKRLPFVKRWYLYTD